jgi:hypothetical protein
MHKKVSIRVSTSHSPLLLSSHLDCSNIEFTFIWEEMEFISRDPHAPNHQVITPPPPISSPLLWSSSSSSSTLLFSKNETEWIPFCRALLEQAIRLKSFQIHILVLCNNNLLSASSLSVSHSLCPSPPSVSLWLVSRSISHSPFAVSFLHSTFPHSRWFV